MRPGPMRGGRLRRSPMRGGYGTAATTFGCIYLLGMVFCFFLPETKGKPLPQ